MQPGGAWSAGCRAPSGTPAGSTATAPMGWAPTLLLIPPPRGELGEVALTAVGTKKEEEKQVD